MKRTSKYCDIIIPVWNRPVKTQACLESLLACTSFPFRICLIDNASHSPTKQVIDSFVSLYPERIQVIRNDENLGYIHAVNQGLNSSSAPFLCLLNSDTVVTPWWLSEMIRITESEQKIGLVNPDSNNFGLKPQGKSPNEMARSCKKNDNVVIEQAGCTGFCMLIKRAVLDSIGTFDEEYGMGFFEDSDFSFRARKAGFLCVRALHAYVHHEQHASFDLLGDWNKDFQHNKERFESRWGTLQRIAVILNRRNKSSIPEKLVAFLRSSLDTGAGITIFCTKRQCDVLIEKWKNQEYLPHTNLTFSKLPSLFIPWKIFFKKKKFTDIVIKDTSYSMSLWTAKKTGAEVEILSS